MKIGNVEKGSLVLVPHWASGDKAPMYAILAVVGSVFEQTFYTVQWQVLQPMSGRCILPPTGNCGRWVKGMNYLLAYGDSVTSGAIEIGFSHNIFCDTSLLTCNDSGVNGTAVGPTEIAERLRTWPGYERHADIIEVMFGSAVPA